MYIVIFHYDIPPLSYWLQLTDRNFILQGRFIKSFKDSSLKLYRTPGLTRGFLYTKTHPAIPDSGEQILQGILLPRRRELCCHRREQRICCQRHLRVLKAAAPLCCAEVDWRIKAQRIEVILHGRTIPSCIHQTLPSQSSFIIVSICCTIASSFARRSVK